MHGASRLLPGTLEMLIPRIPLRDSLHGYATV
jgi:hypothetical protein